MACGIPTRVPCRALAAPGPNTGACPAPQARAPWGPSTAQWLALNAVCLQDAFIPHPTLRCCWGLSPPSSCTQLTLPCSAWVWRGLAALQQIGARRHGMGTGNGGDESGGWGGGRSTHDTESWHASWTGSGAQRHEAEQALYSTQDSTCHHQHITWARHFRSTIKDPRAQARKIEVASNVKMFALSHTSQANSNC